MKKILLPKGYRPNDRKRGRRKGEGKLPSSLDDDEDRIAIAFLSALHVCKQLATTLGFIDGAGNQKDATPIQSALRIFISLDRGVEYLSDKYPVVDETQVDLDKYVAFAPSAKKHAPPWRDFFTDKEELAIKRITEKFALLRKPLVANGTPDHVTARVIRLSDQVGLAADMATALAYSLNFQTKGRPSVSHELFMEVLLRIARPSCDSGHCQFESCPTSKRPAKCVINGCDEGVCQIPKCENGICRRHIFDVHRANRFLGLLRQLNKQAQSPR